MAAKKAATARRTVRELGNGRFVVVRSSGKAFSASALQNVKVATSGRATATKKKA